MTDRGAALVLDSTHSTTLLFCGKTVDLDQYLGIRQSLPDGVPDISVTPLG